jgi:homoprotocatechuate degradation regulator HpaR
MTDDPHRAAPSSEPRRLRGFSDSLPMALLRAREALMRHFRPMLRHFDLTEQQWRVLRALSAADAADLGELANRTLLLGPSLSRILRDMETRGLVLRSADADDQRVGRVALAPAGAALIEEVGAHSEAIYAELAARLGADRIDEALRLSRDIDAALGAGAPIAPALPPRAAAKRSRRGRPLKR